MEINKSPLIILFFTCVIFLFCGPVYSATKLLPIKSVIVTGSGKIINNDTARAREFAISESLVSALDKVFAEMITTDQMVKNFVSLNQLIYSQTNEFIQGYRVLAETKHKNLYRVMVQARVITKKIKSELSSMGLMTNTALPKILFLIEETNIDDTVPSYWWGEGISPVETTAEISIAEAMKKKGFTIISPAPLPDNLKAEVADIAELDNETAIKIGENFHADIVIIGKSTGEILPNTLGQNFKSFRGTITVRAVSCEKGEEIANTIKSDISASSDETAGGTDAIARAGAMVGQDLSFQIIKSLQKIENESKPIKIFIMGKNYLANFVKLKKAISGVDGVKKIQTLEMSPDEAIISVDYNDKPQKLAQTVVLNSFDSFGINIFEVTEDHIKIEIVPETKVPVSITDETLKQ